MMSKPLITHEEANVLAKFIATGQLKVADLELAEAVVKLQWSDVKKKNKHLNKVVVRDRYAEVKREVLSLITSRIASNNITELKDNEVFVFGSNEGGRHGAGAARTALKWGAVYGQAEGLQGKTYAIPTVNASISNTLTIDRIKTYVDRFIEFAKSTPKLKFFVTEIGCGLAGLKVSQVAPLFQNAVDVQNIYLPKRFWHELLK